MEETQSANQVARDALKAWQQDTKQNVYSSDPDFIHTIKFCFADDFARVNGLLAQFGQEVATHLEPLVNENNLSVNLPRLESYEAIGNRVDKIIHHPSYIQAGDIIYSTKILEKMSKPGGLLECLSLLFLSSQAGEAGHNCPIACSAGIVRVLQKVPDFPHKAFYLEKLTSPSIKTNFTGAQFLTEIQGGSDVGLNASYAKQDKQGTWRVYGEKWFCSNAGANLMFVMARYDETQKGTKGLGLFLVPAEWDGEKNSYTIQRLKDKIGTRSMATGEINFHGAYALPMGKLEDGFHLVMDNVLHLSRLFNTFSVLGMARRAYFIAKYYAEHRIAFGHPIIDYPLVKETLARIKSENTALLAGICATARLQDDYDSKVSDDKKIKLLLRLLVNFQKYLSAYLSVQHINQALGVLAGNGAIESFSSISRLLRDCIVCENWEGTHNVLRAQILRDIVKYDIDQIYLQYMRNEINKIKDGKEIASIMKGLEELASDVTSFRQLSEDMQSLEIKRIVDKMAYLYCALMLFIEAQHQEKNSEATSKFDNLKYFIRLHLARNDTYDNDYLELVRRINQPVPKSVAAI